MNDMWVYAILVLFLLIVIWDIERKESKNKKYIGDIGEKVVHGKLSCLGDEYDIENDVHIGGAQIDHLVVNHEHHACFVIETKLWGGIISGQRNDIYWKQYKNGEFKYFKNPIKQNDYHCKVIEKSYPEYKVYNMVVFIKNKNIPHIRNVINENEILDYIKGVTETMDLTKQKPLP